MKLTDYVSIASFAFAIISFAISLMVTLRAKKNERKLMKIAKEEAAKAALIQALQGEKESIGFTALRLSKEGLPQDEPYRSQILLSLVQAAIFSSSDRARAMIYSVLRDNYRDYEREISDTITSVENMFKQFELFHLNKDELDLERGNRRLRALKTVLDMQG